MHNSKLKRISLAVCFALIPLAADAAGLGKLTVISGLGEPLNAEVELLSTTKEELASLTAQIASSKAFADQGIERAAALSNVRIEVSKRPDGTPILRLTSSQPINDPFLDMLLEVDWSSGRLLREYTALLDPPGYNNQSSTSTAELPSAKAVPSEPIPGAATEALPSKAKGRKQSAKVAAEPTTQAQPEDHTVQKGDTLHSIAVQSQVEGVSLEQMLVGLYRANKNAFAGNNMNRLKVGQIVHVPDQAELQSVSQQEAVKEIRVQTADWNTYRNKLAGMVQESAAAKEEPTSQSVSGKISAPAEDKSTPPAPGPRDVVKLSKNEGAKTDASRLNALQEEVTAREKAVKEANDRVAALEKQLQDMQKLLDIKNKALADAQNAGKAPQAAQPEPPKPAVPPQAVAPTPPAAPVEPAKPMPGAVKPESAKPAPTPEQKKPKKIVRPAPPPPEPSLLDTLLDNPMLLGAGGGLIALLGGAWFWRNKRKKGTDSFEQGILTTGGLKPNTVFGNTVGGTVDTGSTSFLTDFGQGATGMIDTNDVDPIAEAEVYMAYGRDAQAEEILKDAIAKEPKRYELHLKLLEIFAHRKDHAAFETLAAELYAALGAADPLWAKVAELGRGLEPGNPLYAESAAQAIENAAPEPVDFEATMIQPAPKPAEDDLDLGIGEGDASLDLSLDEPAVETPASQTEEESNTLDFDLGGLEMPAEPTQEETQKADISDETEFPDIDLSPAALETVPEETGEQESAGLDFEFDLPEPVAADSAQLDMAELGAEEMPAPAETSPMDEEVAELSLDLPELGMPEPVAEAPVMPSQNESAAELALPDIELPAQDVAESGATTEPEVSEISLDFAAFGTDTPASTKVEEMPELPAMPEAGDETIEEISLEHTDLPQADESGSPASVSPDVDFGDFDLPPAAAEPAAAAAAASDESATTDETAGLDFNFDIDLGDLDSQTTVAETAADDALPDLNLSGISLDMAEEEVAPAVEPIKAESDVAVESPDVDTKLDLVTAYMDMGDQEGARELLEEVLKEGGPVQREKAQKLLDGLG